MRMLGRPLQETLGGTVGTKIRYGYNAYAQRLESIAGRKVLRRVDPRAPSERVIDASGQLISSISRVYDALNRVQSVSGAMR